MNNLQKFYYKHRHNSWKKFTLIEFLFIILGSIFLVWIAFPELFKF